MRKPSVVVRRRGVVLAVPTVWGRAAGATELGVHCASVPVIDPGTGGETRRDALGQLVRFGYVGFVTVLIDFALYRVLTAAGAPVAPSKALSFVVATVCAYLLNRAITFRAEGGRREVTRFALLYSFALLVNVAMNELMLALLPDSSSFEVEAAFLVAQATSSTINFVGMRQFVFTNRAQPVSEHVEPEVLTTEHA